MRKTVLAHALMLAASPRAFATNPAPEVAKTTAPRVEPVLTGVAKIAMPERTNKRGSESKYPFDNLTEVGQAFGVKNKTAAQLSSIVSNANRKAQKPVTDDAGNPTYEMTDMKDAAGNIIGQVPDTSKPITAATKHFFAFDVTDEYKAANKAAFGKGGDFEGATALVFRDK